MPRRAKQPRKRSSARLTRFWHYFKRRALEHRITESQHIAAAANFTLTEARAAAEAIEKEPLPEFPGLLVETRRAINIAAIAYAEVLCLRLAKTPLVRLAREATSLVGEIDIGPNAGGNDEHVAVD